MGNKKNWSLFFLFHWLIRFCFFFVLPFNFFAIATTTFEKFHIQIQIIIVNFVNFVYEVFECKNCPTFDTDILLVFDILRTDPQAAAPWVYNLFIFIRSDLERDPAFFVFGFGLLI